jgi:hypothetical protein
MDRKRTTLALLLFATLGLLALFPWAGLTGEYHFGGSLNCYDCHSIHYSQQHGDADANPPAVPPTPGGPFGFLLRAGGINGLCLSCHDGQSFAPDVLGNHANGYVRQAGALNNLSGAAPYEDWKGHTLDITTTPPGGSSIITITCTNCHGAHGTSNYRNITAASGLTYTKDQPYASRTKTVDLWLKQWVMGDLAGNYAYDSVRFNERNTLDSAYAIVCTGCHPTFHGPVGGINIGGNISTGAFVRHPNSQVNIGEMGGGHSSIAQYNAGLYRVHVMSNSDTDYLANPGSGTLTVADGLTPSCFSCHKAHGNQNPFGLIFLARDSSTVTEEGTPEVSTGIGLRDLCGQCHVQGN